MSDHKEAQTASSVTPIRSAHPGKILEAANDLQLECAACRGAIGTHQTCAVWTSGRAISVAHLECVEFAQAIGGAR